MAKNTIHWRELSQEERVRFVAVAQERGMGYRRLLSLCNRHNVPKDRALAGDVKFNHD